MVYPEHVTLEMKTTLYGKPGIKTIDTTAKITNLGEVLQFDFALTNEDLRHRKFIIDEDCVIFHGDQAYRCTDKSFTKGRPHHVVAFANPIN